MIAFFDSNIYAYVAENDCAATLRRELDRERVQVLLSNVNVVETARISDQAVRKKRTETLGRVASSFEEPASNILEAREFFNAARFHRKPWFARPKSSKKELERQRQRAATYRRILAGDPTFDPSAYLPGWEMVHEEMVDGVHEYQKELRAMRQDEKAGRLSIRLETAPDVARALTADENAIFNAKPELERFVRLMGLYVWRLVLIDRSPMVLDLVQWMDDRVRRPDAACSLEALARFLLIEVGLERLPVLVARHAVAFLQPNLHVSRSNANDNDQAPLLLRGAAFVTADMAFAE